MDRAQKKELVTTLNSVFKETGVVVVTHNLGLTVPQMNALRSKMAEAGGATKVAKNRLAKLALEGTDVAGIADLFTIFAQVVDGDDLKFTAFLVERGTEGLSFGAEEKKMGFKGSSTRTRLMAKPKSLPSGKTA